VRQASCDRRFGSMALAYRKLTAAVLLASYVAATLGAWTHSRHDCGEIACHSGACDRAKVAESHATADSHESRNCPHAGHLASETLIQSSHDARSHHLDQCLVCQFLAIQKVLSVADGSAPTSTVLAERLVCTDHVLLTAERFGMPESRGPPRGC
jgi:hypothetical protein